MEYAEENNYILLFCYTELSGPGFPVSTKAATSSSQFVRCYSNLIFPGIEQDKLSKLIKKNITVRHLSLVSIFA